jgi:hypothetical protein
MADPLASSLEELDLEEKATDSHIIIQGLVQRCQALNDEVEQYIAAVDAHHKGSKLPLRVEYRGLRYVQSALYDPSCIYCARRFSSHSPRDNGGCDHSAEID